MHNGSMPWIHTTAFGKKAALAQGGFFVFVNPGSFITFFREPYPCPFPPHPLNPLTVFQPRLF